MDISDVTFTDLYIDASDNYFAKNKEVLVDLSPVDKDSIFKLKTISDGQYQKAVTQFLIQSENTF